MSRTYGNIGALGNIPFYVSNSGVQTISNVTMSGGARYSQHKRRTGVAMAEFTGLDPEVISFDIRLSRHLGVDPWQSLDQLLKAERNGTLLPLTLGSRSYGRYRWVIVSHKAKVSQFDNRGDMADITVSVKLLEYVKG